MITDKEFFLITISLPKKTKKNTEVIATPHVIPNHF